MTNLTLMPLTGAASTGTAYNIGTSITQANFQMTPQASAGFSGTIVLEGSSSPSPTVNDWFNLATLVFSAHNSTVDFNMYFTNTPWIRARLPAAGTQGAISVYMAY